MRSQPIIILMAMWACLLIVSSAHGGARTYLELDNIAGDTTNTSHRCHTEVSSWIASGGVPRPSSMTGTRGSGRDSGGRISILTRQDSATRSLKRNIAAGNHVGRVSLQIQNMPGKKGQAYYVEIRLTNAVIQSYKPGSGGTEEITFGYNSINFMYTSTGPAPQSGSEPGSYEVDSGTSK